MIQFYVLINWVEGPEGKIFGSRSGRTDLAVLTESQILSRPAQPNSGWFSLAKES